jgi:CheY-like chemotaxis protein
MNLPLKRILLVDDSPRDIEMELDAFAQQNLVSEVVVARDGAEALDYLYRRAPFADRATDQPDVVLLDVKMPRVDGLEVLRQIKSSPQLKTIPVVMMTSSRLEQDLMRSYQLGVNAYVVKPVHFLEFVEAVKLASAFWVGVNEPPPDSGPVLQPKTPEGQQAGGDE